MVAASTLALAMAASTTRLCDGGVYDRFDFWIGDWKIEQRVHGPDGRIETFPAMTSVRRSADGCVITEHWRGPTRLFWYGMERPQDLWGYSVRRVDPSTGRWTISWIDGKNISFGAPFIGGFDGSEGLFYQDGKERRGRIRFRPQADGSVQWDLAISPAGRAAWRTLWEMEMRRLESNDAP